MKQAIDAEMFARELRVRGVTIEDVARAALVGERTVYEAKTVGVMPRTIDRLSVAMPSIRKMLREGDER